MMNHQLNLPWELSGMTLCLGLTQPVQLPHQWVVISADGQSMGSAGSKLPADLDFDLGSSVVEDLFYQQAPSFTIAQKSLTLPSKPIVNETFISIDDFNLPSSPESVDFDDLYDLDPELLAFDIDELDTMDVYSSQSDIFNKCLTPENTHVELAVQDPEIAMNLLQQLGSEKVNAANPNLNVFQAIDTCYISNLSAVETSLVSSEPQSAHQAYQLAPMDLLAEPAFQVDNFFATPQSSELFFEVSDNSETASDTLKIKRSCSSDELVGLTSSSHTGLVPQANTSGYFFSAEPLQRPPPSSTGSLSDNDSTTSDFSDVKNTGTRSPIARPEKRLRKKEQNKTAALKYRQKKRTEQGTFLSECQEIEKKNAGLKQRVSEITREINYLKGLLAEIAA